MVLTRSAFHARGETPEQSRPYLSVSGITMGAAILSAVNHTIPFPWKANQRLKKLGPGKANPSGASQASSALRLLNLLWVFIATERQEGACSVKLLLPTRSTRRRMRVEAVPIPKLSIVPLAEYHNHGLRLVFIHFRGT